MKVAQLATKSPLEKQRSVNSDELVRMKSPHRPEKEKEKPPRVGMEGRRFFLPFTELTRGSVRTIVDEGALRIIAVWGNQSESSSLLFSPLSSRVAPRQRPSSLGST